MTVAFDAFASKSTQGNISWTHTPVGTPKGAIVFVVQEDSTAIEITGATYGGVSMAEVAGSPSAVASSADNVVHGFFIGSSVNGSSQTVTVTVSSTTVVRNGASITLTAGGNTEIADTTIFSGVGGSPSDTLSLGGKTCFCAEALHSGRNALSGITPLTNWTSRFEFDFGSRVSGVYTYDTIASVDVTVGWSQSIDDYNCVSLAVAESPNLVLLRRRHEEGY